MLILRDYQQDLVSKTFTAWSCGIRKVLLQLSTGGGKTIIFAAITSEFIAQGEGVLVVGVKTRYAQNLSRRKVL